jgi:23S rRNA pseudouridine2605 synthase
LKVAEERIQKILSRWGVASRRKAEELIAAGKVQVNGKTILELGSKADPDVDDIRVIGKHIRPPRQAIYLALHKPKGCVTTVSDPEHRQTVMEFVKDIKERIYPIGRLDYQSEGLLLFTNDGDFANALLAARNKVPKIYEVKVNGYLDDEQQATFERGVPLHGRRTAPARIRVLRRGQNPWYEVELVEGRTNQIRIMFQHLGLNVEKLKRTRIGFLELGDLAPTEYRLLTLKEVLRFRRDLHLDKQ